VPQDRKVYHRLLSEPPRASRIDAWKREMPAEDIRAFERIAGRALRRYGYGVSPVMEALGYADSAIERVRRWLREGVGQGHVVETGGVTDGHGR